MFDLIWQPKNQRTLMLPWLLLLMSGAGRAAESGEPPFVAGFERFARHGDLTPAEAGGLLISELNCIACHASSDLQLSPKGGPSLVGAANRFSGVWLEEYLADPTRKKSGTTMPHLLGHLDQPDRQVAVKALVAFLSTQNEALETVRGTGAVPVMHEFWNRGDPARGRHLYHTVGCVACHQADADYETVQTVPTAIDQMIQQLDSEELQEIGLLRAARRVESVPHGDLVGKYTRQALTLFLLRPDVIRKGARMPSMRLSPSEAADITAHLLRDQPEDFQNTNQRQDAALIDQGRLLFVELRCANCHEATGIKAAKPAKAWNDLDTDREQSCLDGPIVGMPEYNFDATQVAALRATLQAVTAAAKPLASQLVHRRMLQLNCYACHQRDTVLVVEQKAVALGGVGRDRKAYFETVEQVDLGDEGRLPPALTGVGRKLQSRTLQSVFNSRTAAYRSHMRVRMPAYHPTVVKDLVEQLPKADQIDNASEQSVFGTSSESLLKTGHALSDTGCVECHPFGGESLPGVVGIDLAGITSRVRPEWFHDFVLDPGSLKNRTRMPTFFPDGKSNRQDLLGGDVEKQLASLWFYLKDLANQPLPEKIEKVRSQNYELRPEKRPVLLRSFMRDAGTHAIAVGFPEQVHYSFDSEKIRLASAWKGRFVDARGTWFERFTPPADPLGESIVRFPQGPPFAVLDRQDAAWPAQKDQESLYQFRGYRLDPKGVPTFVYRFAHWQVEERIEPMEQRGLRRQWKIRREKRNSAEASDESGTLNLCIHQAKKLKRQQTTQVDGDGLQVRIVRSPGVNGPDDRIITAGKTEQWIVPLNRNDQQTVVVEYLW